MSKNYDMIATVDIDIATPIVDDTGFDSLLIVGSLPRVAPQTAPADVGMYSSLEEVIDAGWSVNGENPDPIALAAQVAFSQNPKPHHIYIAPRKTVVVDEEEGETAEESATETIARALAVNGWYVVCTAGVNKSEYGAIAAMIETQEKMFMYTELDCFGTGGNTCVPTVDPIYYRTKAIYGKERTNQDAASIPAANLYLAVAYAAKWLSYEPGSETSAFKSLAAVYPSELTKNEMELLKGAHLDFFVSIGSRNLTMNGMVLAGEWADTIRFRDWLKNDMQVRIVNLFATTPKIPYTDSGIALIQNQMLASLKLGQDMGGIAEDEFDENGERIAGYQTSVPLAASITASQKMSRILTNCKFKARLAGAIHFAEISGSLTYEI